MLGVIAAVVAAVLVALGLHRFVAGRRMRRSRVRLTMTAPPSVHRFDPAQVRELPAPARRWLERALAPGASLASVALLRMHGTLRLKRGAEPLPMEADQVLVPSLGYIWRARMGRGALHFGGWDRYDGAGELRWWLWGILPVASRSNDEVARSAAGRLAGEALLVPSSMLRGNGAQWEPIDGTTACVRRVVHGEEVEMIVRVSEDGRLERAVIRRWNTDRANGPKGYLPFVVEFEGERTFGSVTVPAVVRAGWGAMDDSADDTRLRLEEVGDVDPFFVAELDSILYV